MKKGFTKVCFGLFSLYLCAFSSENIKRSLQTTSLTQLQSSQSFMPKYQVSKDVLKSLENKAIVDVGKTLNIDTSLFNKKKKFSLYLKLSKNSKFGFKYKF